MAGKSAAIDHRLTTHIPASACDSGRGGGGAYRGGEAISPGLLYAERKRVRQQAMVFVGIERWRFLCGQLIALGKCEISARMTIPL